MHSLEPVYLKKNTIVQDENEEVGSVIFLRGKTMDKAGNTMKYFVGFSTTNSPFGKNDDNIRFPLKFGPHRPIGDYNVTYDVKSDFIYKIEKNCDALFCRREKWQELMEERN